MGQWSSYWVIWVIYSIWDGVLFSIDFFVCLFVCLFISLFLWKQDYEKTAGPICIKLSGKVWSDHETTWLHFWSIPKNRAMPRCATRGAGFVVLSHHSLFIIKIVINVKERKELRHISTWRKHFLQKNRVHVSVVVEMNNKHTCTCKIKAGYLYH